MWMGTYDVYRKIDRSWKQIVPRTKADAIHMGVNAVNRMKIAFNNISHSVTLFITMIRKWSNSRVSHPRPAVR